MGVTEDLLTEDLKSPSILKLNLGPLVLHVKSIFKFTNIILLNYFFLSNSLDAAVCSGESRLPVPEAIQNMFKETSSVPVSSTILYVML